MIANMLSMGGYALFVWSAYIFSFVLCLFLYIRVKNDLTQYERKFLSKLKFMPYKKFKTIRSQKIVKTVLAKKS